MATFEILLTKYNYYTMKSIIRDFAQVCFALLFLISTKALAQESPSFTITPELSKQIVEKYNLEAFKVYPVISKEVEYYPYVDGEIITKDYKYELNRLEQYKPAFDEYNNVLKANSAKREAIQTITKNIDDFLASNEKYEVKEKLLIESQELANKNDIVIQVSDDRIKLSDFLNTPNTNHNIDNSVQRIVFLYQQKKKTTKNDLLIFKNEMMKIKLKEPEETHNYRMYLEVSKDILQVPKTERGRVLSDKVSRKSVYVIQDTPVDLSVLSGDFIELPEKYSIITEDVAGKFVKNELFTRTNEHYNEYERQHRNDENYTFNDFIIIKKSRTNELYYIMSDRFIGQLKLVLEGIAYQNIGNTVEYKVWKGKYLSLLQSAQVNISSCNAIIAKHTFRNMLGEKRYDSSNFSKQEKMTFNKNLDLLKEKLDKIGELAENRDFLSFYNDKASDEDAVKSYAISTYYNTTGRAY